MKRKMNTFIVYLTAFLSGFSLMGYEILGGRVLAPYFGSSAFVWGALISVFMLGLSLGYYFGGKLADKRKNFSDLVFIFIFTAIFIFSVSLLGKKICLYFSLMEFDIRLSLLAASLLLFFIPCFFLGIVQPYLVTIFSEANHKIGRSVGSVYSISTLGNIFGVITVAFFFINYFGTSNGIKAVCIPLLVCAFLSFLFKTQKNTES